MRQTLPEVDPHIVVVTFGGNDAQGITDADGRVHHRRPGRHEESGRRSTRGRVGEVMDLLTEDGRTVIWVGIPNDDNPEVTERMAVQDEAVQAPAAERARTCRSSTRGPGSPAATAAGPSTSSTRATARARTCAPDDGFHLNETGAEILALDIAEVVKADLRARGADI